VLPQSPRPPLPTLRPNYFNSDNVPFRYNSAPAVPEVHMTAAQAGPDSPSEAFANFQGGGEEEEEEEEGMVAAPSSYTTLQRPYPARPIRAEILDDWSAKVSGSTDGKQTVLLDTKYFSLSYPEDEVTSPHAPLTPSGRPGLVLRKVKGRMKTSTEAATTARRVTTAADLCGEGHLLECDTFTTTNLTTVETKEDKGPASSFATYKELLKHFKKEVWVIPVLIAAGIITLILTIYEIFLLAKAINKNPSRRHLFLGQMLLAGLAACSAMAVVHTLRPTVATCAVLRLGTGLAYSLVYSTLLVKLVFLISLNSGVYLPATYQSLLLSFAILIQLVIGVQWLVSAPPAVTQVPLARGGEALLTCATLFQQQLLGLLYVVFLIIVVVLLSFKSRGVRENYREAMYVSLTIGFTVAIWLVWILAGFIVPTRYQDVCAACGLIACTAITFVIMFMPKGRQLSAMGREGVYAEDRTDVYTGTGSGTGSTGSSGTPSPSFFPVKPGKLGHGVSGSRLQFREKEREFKERIPERDRLDTPPSAHKHLQRQSSRQDDNIYTSLEALHHSRHELRHSERFPYKSQPSRHNPNVLFRRPTDVPAGFMY